jgi:Lysylphosphatidylglycerol synthase TM region
MLFLFYTVYLQLSKQPDWKYALRQLLLAKSGKQQWKLYGMIFLMFVNWSLETVKWQIAIRSIQVMKFIPAFKAVLAGTCIASFTPNRVGEYLGRMMFIEKGNKISSVAPTILCSMSQMLITFIAGSVGLFFMSSLSFRFKMEWLNPSFFKTAMIVSGFGALVLGLVYFKFDPLIFQINKWLERKQKKFSMPLNFNLGVLAAIFSLSVLRYTVFIIQYYLLFSLFGITMNGMEVFTGVSVMFVLLAIVPTLTFLTDLGIRWLAGIQIFQIFTANTAGIVAASLGIWFINLIIPALIGSLLILRIKLFASNEII